MDSLKSLLCVAGEAPCGMQMAALLIVYATGLSLTCERDWQCENSAVLQQTLPVNPFKIKASAKHN